jgi:FkbM family methyltransferase
MSLYARRMILKRDSRRVRQTPGAFSNWPTVLRDLALEKLGRGPEVLHFETRTGLRIDTPNHPGARVPIYEIFAEDCYELQWFVGALGAAPMNVLDIGGHVGTFSCQLASVYPKSEIWTFEPSATTADFLRRNVEQNGFGSRIHVAQRAISREEGVATFDDNGAGSGHNGLVSGKRRLVEEEFNHGSGRTVEVATSGLDDVFAQMGGKVDLIKIDCEGAEYDMIYGSDQKNWSSVQRLVLEYHHVEGQSWDELRAWFAAVGLSVMKDEPVSPGLGTAWLSREALPAPEHAS